MTAKTRPVRVAIVGGGCAAVSAAFSLTQPELRGAYQVTLYQMGWRLGGKGASGRGPSGRIEEHGLHLWLGFYENAFRLMRDCYAELDRDPATHPLATWQDAFSPAPHVAVADRAPNGAFEAWVGRFPPGSGLPGDAFTESDPFTMQAYARRATALLIELIRSARPSSASETTRAARNPEAWVEAADRLLKYGRLATSAAIFEATDILRAAMDAVVPADLRSQGIIFRLIDALADTARQQMGAIARTDTELHRTWQVIDLIVAILRGWMRFGLAVDKRGFDAINGYDWREWLRLNGACDESLDSGFVRGIYDLVFAFEDGDPQRPALAAGVALRGAMRMFFTYRGAMFWRMHAGMGDVMFAPLYEVLRRRGVRFEFFHQLRHVAVDAPKRALPYVKALGFDVQARVRRSEYRPLVDIAGLPCWPSAPDYAQLVDGAALKREGRTFEAPWEQRRAGTKTLRVGDDFDLVVLAVPVGVLPSIGAELLKQAPHWQTMVRHTKTVATQAAQIWLTEDMESLGWRHPQVTFSGFVEPFDTWADMRHLIPRETWKTPVKSIAYFCSPLPSTTNGSIDAGAHGRARQRVRDHAVRFLTEDVPTLWPNTRGRDGRFRWDLLASDGRRSRALDGPARFDTQFWSANVSPSDRYTLSTPGSPQYRISPLELAFDNLTVAGDWTQSGLDSGCVESAVMSGMLAAHAITGYPALHAIVGYDHP